MKVDEAAEQEQSTQKKYAPLPLALAIDQYREEHCIPNGGDKQRVGYMSRDFIAFYGGEKPVHEIGRKEGRDFAHKRIQLDGLSSATARRELSMLRAIIGHAVKEDRAAKAPKFWMPPASPPRTRYLTRDEHRRLMQSAMPPRTKMFFLIAFNTGARAEAIEELEWSRVDLDRRTIDFRCPGVVYKNKRRVVAPINDSLLPRLEAAKARASDEFVIGAGCNTYFGCKAALRAIGIDERGCARHVARHTFASWLLQAGVPIFEVARLLGDTVGMVDKVYGHIATDQLMGASNKI